MIVVPGSINLDMIARVERLPDPGETVRGPSFATTPGGKGANQALAARRAGADVAMIGAVGTDAQAVLAIDLIKQAGVDLSHVRTLTDETVSTGVALILVDDRRGENMIAVVAGANGHVSAADVAARPISPGDVVLAQMEIPADAVKAAFQAGKAAGARTILNTAPYTGDVAPLSGLADIVVANETEFDLLADDLKLGGHDREGRMQAFFDKTGATVVVTLGADGAVAVTADGLQYAEAPRIDPVDTVGAGDTFCGYLATALHAGEDWSGALSLAVRAGAAACLKPGAQPSIPLRAELD